MFDAVGRCLLHWRDPPTDDEIVTGPAAHVVHTLSIQLEAAFPEAHLSVRSGVRRVNKLDAAEDSEVPSRVLLHCITCGAGDDRPRGSCKAPLDVAGIELRHFEE